MTELLNIQNTNLGGLHLLRFAPRHFFSSTDPVAGLTFLDGLDWIRVRLTSETGVVEHDASLDGTDAYYNISVTAALPKEREEIDKILDKYKGLPCLVWFTDQNGNTRLSGHYAGELVLMHSSTTGKVTADENGYEITFKGKQEFKADFITS